MKVNLKKIGAIVAGATILASSVAFAGLWFGNTELVNANGAPGAKVVVGEKAAASDGVAAAQIASAMAASAFRTSTLTAEVAGVDSVTCALGSSSSTASCAVSDEKVKLEVTVPGATDTSVYELKPLIGETTDRTLQDRGTGSQSTYALTNAETSTDANPFSDGENSNIGGSTTSLFKIDGSNYAGFKDVTLLDKDSGKSFKEEQKLFIRAESQYKSNDDTVDARYRDVIYQIKFTQDSYGMPVCDQVNSSQSWAGCGTSDDHNLGNHKIKIRFLGDDWVITKLDSSDISTTPNNSTRVVAGGTVELSKESVGGIINVGDSLDAGNGYKVILDDIKSGTTSSEQSAIISLVDANGQTVKQTTVAPGSTSTLTTVTGGSQILVRVYKTAPGYTFGAKWADMAVLSNQLTLKNADSTIEVNGEREKNQDWTVALGWKNRDTGSSNVTDHLRSIIVYRDTQTDWLTPGNGVNLLETPVGYKLLYKGLDLDKSSSDDYDTLRFAVSDGSFSFKFDSDQQTSISVNSNSYVDVTSDVSNAFTTSAGSGNKLRVVFGNATTIFSTQLNTSGPSAGGAAVIHGSILLQLSNGYWVNVGNTSLQGASVNTATSSGFQNVSYSTAGTSATSHQGGALFFAFGGNGSTYNNVVVAGGNFSLPLSTPSNNTFIFGVSEDTGDGQSVNSPDGFAVAYDITAKSLNKDFTQSGTPGTIYAKDKVTWAPAYNLTASRTDDVYGNTAAGTQEVNFVTERGSIITDKSDSSFTTKIARKVAHAITVLQPSTTETTTPGAQVFTGTEGDVFDAGKGVKVKVVEISQAVGACGVGTGAAPACTSDTSGVSAVIMPDNKASVVAGVPYGYSNLGSLVVLDKDAIGTDVLVTVGGPAVNEVTKEVLAGSSVDFNTETKVVKEVVDGKKIVVAGLTADDTLEAARDFIAALKSQ